MPPNDRDWGQPCPSGDIVELVARGVNFPGGIHRRAVQPFKGLASEFHEQVEPLQNGACWGYDCRNISGSDSYSYHAWGLAIDVNAPDHPQGQQGTFTAKQADTCRQLAEKYGMRWGGDYTSTVDEMHFEFMGSPDDAETSAFSWSDVQDRAGDAVDAVLPQWVKDMRAFLGTVDNFFSSVLNQNFWFRALMVVLGLTALIFALFLFFPDQERAFRRNLRNYIGENTPTESSDNDAGTE